MMSRYNWLSALAAMLVIFAFGCSQGAPQVVYDEPGFESDDPGVGPTSVPPPSDGSNNSGPIAECAPTAGSEAFAADSARVLREADRVQRAGSRLYVLTRSGALAIIETHEGHTLQLLSTYPLGGKPLEFYVEGDRAHVLVNERERWIADGPGGRWASSSELITLDVSRGESPYELERFELPGSFTDSRKIGDRLYVVTHDSGTCAGCELTSNTRVSSFIVERTHLRPVDSVRIYPPRDTYDLQPRSLYATKQRLFLAGATGLGFVAQSEIHVVDISDEGGRMTLGAKLAVAGQVNSRWQMDEYEGVLRVVSQFSNGLSGADPRVETFRITSSREISPLGGTALKLTRPESLMAVRFDGTRAYAITAEVLVDPLFTIDLSDPAHPHQRAELKMPGWIHHLEPRGDRLVALGFDPEHPEGILNVSLFDVANLDTPHLLKRVNFGHRATIDPAQDRIHKVFQVLDDQGLILVPFTSAIKPWRDSVGVCHVPQSGVQLIDLRRDDLTLRGVAPHEGAAMRTFVSGDHLFVVSDREASTYDYGDRDAPRRAASLVLNTQALATAVMDSGVTVHVGGTASASLAELTFSRPTPMGLSALSTLTISAPMPATACTDVPWVAWQDAGLFSNGDQVYLAAPIDPFNRLGARAMRLYVIDARDPTKPTLRQQRDIPMPTPSNTLISLAQRSERALDAGSRFLFSGSTLSFFDAYYAKKPREVRADMSRALFVVDLSSPMDPVATRVELPGTRGSTLPFLEGSTVFLSRWQASDTPNKVRFFVERVDIRDPRNPRVLASVNTPGSLVAMLGETWVTADYEGVALETKTANDCRRIGGNTAAVERDERRCSYLKRTLKTLKVAANAARVTGQTSLPGQNIGGVLRARDGLIVTLFPQFVGDSKVYPLLLRDTTTGLWSYRLEDGVLRLHAQLETLVNAPLSAHAGRVAVTSPRGVDVYDLSNTPRLLNHAEHRLNGTPSGLAWDEASVFIPLGDGGLHHLTLAQ
jgi:hypothetical protein